MLLRSRLRGDDVSTEVVAIGSGPRAELHVWGKNKGRVFGEAYARAVAV
jgi:hypothetical protein